MTIRLFSVDEEQAKLIFYITLIAIFKIQVLSSTSKVFKKEKTVDLSFIPKTKEAIARGVNKDSIYIPLIFAALVIKLAHGVTKCRGSDLTKEINTYLVEPRDQKKPNNISRALRDLPLLTQDWLVKEMDGGVKLFSLSDTWERDWNLIFKFKPPVIGFNE